MNTILITIGVIAVVMLAMAVGVLLKGKCLSGSCGGPKVVGSDGKVMCGTCGRQGDEEAGQVTRPREIDFSETRR